MSEQLKAASLLNNPMALLTAEQVAEILQVHLHTLALWRTSRRNDLPFLKIGRLVRYKADSVQKWIDSCAR